MMLNMICENCKKEHDGTYGSGRFCSKECARSYSTKNLAGQLKIANCVDCNTPVYILKRSSINTCRCEHCKNIIIQNKENERLEIKRIKEEQRRLKKLEKERKREQEKLLKKKVKRVWSEESLNKLREAGKKSALVQSENRRSKNEIEFCKLCETHFNTVEHNKAIFNGWDADIIIHDIKYAILWNGKWHYEKITKSHSVEQVQNRDKIKIKEIEKFGYIPYIVKDMGKFDFDFVKKEFENFIKISRGSESG